MTFLPSHKFWIGVVSREHAQIGVKGGFIQLNHGKKAPLQKLGAGDGLLLYSPRTAYPHGDTLQTFTAIGRIVNGDIYQVAMSPEFKPYRIDVDYFQCKEVPIKPLVKMLSFIKNKSHWGAAFRFGHTAIPARDFSLIAAAMGCDLGI